jgi:predicted PurR-regulated permease PerM
MNKNSLNKSVVRFVALLISLACVFIIILGIQSSAYIINSILLAAIITLAVLPLPRKLIQRGMRPNLALILTLLLIVAVLVGIFVLVFTSIDSVATDLAVSEVEETAQADSATGPMDLVTRIQGMVSTEDVNQLLGRVVSASGQIAAQFFAVMMIFIFMLSAGIVTPISDQLERATESPQVGKIMELTEDVQRYISITTLVNFLVGVGNAIFLLILGVPFAILWGLFSWFTGYIPAVGFWLAMIPPVLIAWVTLGLPTAAIVFVGYIVINGSVENLIKPRVMGQGLNISPLVIFVSLFFWGWLLGAVGAILAVPLTMMILSVLDSFEATRWIVVLTRPASSSEGHEKKEASLKLKDLWGKVTNIISSEDAESEENS